jgi:hypothetical protein
MVASVSLIGGQTVGARRHIRDAICDALLRGSAAGVSPVRDQLQLSEVLPVRPIGTSRRRFAQHQHHPHEATCIGACALTFKRPSCQDLPVKRIFVKAGSPHAAFRLVCPVRPCELIGVAQPDPAVNLFSCLQACCLPFLAAGQEVGTWSARRHLAGSATGRHSQCYCIAMAGLCHLTVCKSTTRSAVSTFAQVPTPQSLSS